MPELPEVETIKRGLIRLIRGLSVAAVSFDAQKSFPNSEADVERFLIGHKIINIERKGKALIIELDSGYSLIVHLRMTGQLIYVSASERFAAGHPNDSFLNALPDKSTRVILTFSDGSHLYFNDQRKFGWMRLHPTPAIGEIGFFASLGPEPLASDFSWQDLKGRLSRRSKTSIKAALLDQSVIAGVGNIYADESLYGAKIHPAAIVGDLKDADIKRLHTSLIDILNLSISQGGSTDRNYLDAEGKKGNYLKFARAFRRQGQPCPRCGTPIVKTRVAGRGTHFCPKCQVI